jgi:hypothetical protein
MTLLQVRRNSILALAPLLWGSLSRSMPDGIAKSGMGNPRMPNFEFLHWQSPHILHKLAKGY